MSLVTGANFDADGIGFEPDTINLTNGFVIVTMEHKANAIIANFIITSSPGVCYSVNVEVPLS